MNIILYSIHCPRCHSLEMSLKKKNITYEEITDVEEMKKLGYQCPPILVVDGQAMNFSEAIDWIKRH